MQLHIKSPKIWLASSAIDFRKGPNSLCELVASNFDHKINDGIFVFYNVGRNKIKLIGYHRNGIAMIYKYLDKKKFTVGQNKSNCCELNEEQLSWLLAGLDWMEMSGFKEIKYEDYF